MAKRNEKITNLKNTAGVVTAIAAFSLGWLLTIISFFYPPEGQVHDSVLWILGQGMSYCGAILGVGMYFKANVEKFRRDSRHWYEQMEEPSDSCEGGEDNEKQNY